MFGEAVRDPSAQWQADGGDLPTSWATYVNATDELCCLRANEAITIHLQGKYPFPAVLVPR